MAKVLTLAAGIGLSLIGYLGTQALLRSEELDVLRKLIQEKITPIR